MFLCKSYCLFQRLKYLIVYFQEYLLIPSYLRKIEISNIVDTIYVLCKVCVREILDCLNVMLGIGGIREKICRF